MRRLFAVFGGPITSTAPTSVIVLAIESWARSKSTSRHRNPSTSPRRNPVAASNRNPISNGCPSIATKKSRRSSDDQVVSSALTTAGGRTAAATLRETRPIRSASPSARRKTSCALCTVAGASGPPLRDPDSSSSV